MKTRTKILIDAANELAKMEPDAHDCLCAIIRMVGYKNPDFLKNPELLLSQIHTRVWFSDVFNPIHKSGKAWECGPVIAWKYLPLGKLRTRKAYEHRMVMIAMAITLSEAGFKP